jgi:hypothetical protein
MNYTDVSITRINLDSTAERLAGRYRLELLGSAIRRTPSEQSGARILDAADEGGTIKWTIWGEDDH